MFERFTDRARRVVVVAQEEARSLNHNYIGTEHLLLGLFGDESSVAGRALSALGLAPDDVRARVVEIVGAGIEPPGAHLPFTPRAKKVLELALREAMQLGHNYIGTEHILLGLVREGDGVAAQVLTSMGTDLESTRDQVTSLLSGVFVLRGESAPVRTSDAVRSALAAAADLAGEEHVASHHLLIAALRDPDSAATQALVAAGIDPTTIVEALSTAQVVGTNDESAVDRGMRHLQLQLADDSVVLDLSDPEMLKAAREAWERLQLGTDDSLAGDDPRAQPLATLWLAFRAALDALGAPASRVTVELEAQTQAHAVARVARRRRRPGRT